MRGVDALPLYTGVLIIWVGSLASGLHISAARRRRRRIVDPIHAASEKGLGDITPSQDHKPSLAWQIIVDSIGSPPKVAIRRYEPPQSRFHGVVQTLMPSGCGLTLQGEARGRIQRLGYGVHELLHSDEVLHFAIVQVFQMDTGEGVGVLLGPKTLVEGQ